MTKGIQNTDNQTGIGIEVPDNLFDDIIGFEDVKRLVLMGLRAEEPVHYIFVGPPGSAKSMFLAAIGTLPGARLTTGGGTSTTGIRDLYLDEAEPPRLLLVDEVDKAAKKGEDLETLLSLMQSGMVSSLKSGQNQVRTGLKAWVVCAANRSDQLPQALKDRCNVLTLRPYTEDEFKAIVERVLVKKGLSNKEIARYIAEVCVKRGVREVREAERIAKMGKTKKDVDFIVSTTDAYLSANVKRFRCENPKCKRRGHIVRVKTNEKGKEWW